MARKPIPKEYDVLFTATPMMKRRMMYLIKNKQQNIYIDTLRQI